MDPQFQSGDARAMIGSERLFARAPIPNSGHTRGETMTDTERLRLDEVEQRVCDIASEQLGIPRHRISPSDRIIEDLNCDSLDLVELFMEVEEAFGITLPRIPRIRSTKLSSRASPSGCLTWRNSLTFNKERVLPIARVGVRQGTWRPHLPLRRSANSTVVGRSPPLKSKGTLSRWKQRSQLHNTDADSMGCGAC